MQYYQLAVWVCFVFCLALAAGGILVLFQADTKEHKGVFKLLQYFMIQINTFGLYALWSEIFFKMLFPIAPDNVPLESIKGFFTIMGIPFLLIGFVMLILWSFKLIKKRPGTLFNSASLFIALTSVALYLGAKEFMLLNNGQQLYALLTIVVTLFASLLLFISKSVILKPKQRRQLSFFILFPGLIHIPLLLQKISHLYLELVFVFLFFASYALISFYFYFKCGLRAPLLQEYEDPFLNFVARYNITNRESEIIRLIILGKTNKDIAEECFVTVQTIKDHTHRIYTKVGVKNRIQLSNIVTDYKS